MLMKYSPIPVFNPWKCTNQTWGYKTVTLRRPRQEELKSTVILLSYTELKPA